MFAFMILFAILHAGQPHTCTAKWWGRCMYIQPSNNPHNSPPTPCPRFLTLLSPSPSSVLRSAALSNLQSCPLIMHCISMACPTLPPLPPTAPNRCPPPHHGCSSERCTNPLPTSPALPAVPPHQSCMYGASCWPYRCPNHFAGATGTLCKTATNPMNTSEHSDIVATRGGLLRLGRCTESATFKTQCTAIAILASVQRRCGTST